MSGQRMDLAKQALKLFMQSLPPGSQFQIISFGSQFSWYLNKNKMLNYNNNSLSKAKVEIENMHANMGGTNIFSPLDAALDVDCGNSKKRIFLLTDGHVAKP
jgi:hypothetical protein